MYNRSERKQTYLNKQRLDPNFGPGAYTKEALYPLVCGKTLGNQIQVPFLTKSLQPKPITTQLAPTAYDTRKNLTTSQVPVFKNTDHSRFPDTVGLQVSPNAYNITSSLDMKLPVILNVSHKVYVGGLDKEPIQRSPSKITETKQLDWKSVKTIPSIPYPDHGFTTEASQGKKKLTTLIYQKAAHVVCEEISENAHHATFYSGQKSEKGFLFPKTPKILKFLDITETPGPLYYDVVDADRHLYYKTAENAIGDINFRGPKSRLIEMTIEENLKDVYLNLILINF